MSGGQRSGRGHVPRVFVDRPLTPDAQVELQGNPAHHLRTVLRLGPGDAAILFDGRGGEYSATIESADKRYVTLACGGLRQPGRESPLRVTLAQAVARGDRMDYAIAKAVELGVAAIQPLLAERGKVRLACEHAAKKQAHWQRVAIAAAEQSGREQVPAIADLQPLGSWLSGRPPGPALILDPTADRCLRDLPPPDDRGLILIVGPESGLSDAELAQAREADITAVGLGPRVLRAETAGVACLASIQTLWGDFG